MRLRVESAVALQRRFAEFLGSLTDDQLASLIDGRLTLAVSDRTTQRSRGTSALPPADAASTVTRHRPVGHRQRGSRRALMPEPEEAASTLRELSTEEEGSSYLESFKVTVPYLKEVAKALGFELLSKEKRSDALRKVLNQAIGARRKFAGLRQW